MADSCKKLEERVARLEKLGVRREPPLIDLRDLHAKVNKFEKSGVSWPTGLHLALKSLGKLELYDTVMKSLEARVRRELREFCFRIKQLEDSAQKEKLEKIDKLKLPRPRRFSD